MLVAAAAEKLNVDASALITEPGFVVDAAGKRRIAYGELTDAAAKMPVPTDVKLKDPSTFRIVGTPAKRLDVAGKVDGSAVFGIDVKAARHENRHRSRVPGVWRDARIAG